LVVVTGKKGGKKKEPKEPYVRHTPPPQFMDSDPVQYDQESKGLSKKKRRSAETQLEARFTRYPIKKIVAYSSFKKTPIAFRRTAVYLSLIADKVVRIAREASSRAYTDFRGRRNTKSKKALKKHKKDKISVKDLIASMKNDGCIVDSKTGRVHDGISTLCSAFNICQKRDESDIEYGNTLFIERAQRKEEKKRIKEALTEKKNNQKIVKEVLKKQKESKKATKATESNKKKKKASDESSSSSSDSSSSDEDSDEDSSSSDDE